MATPTAGDDDERSLLRWQRRLLPFMTGGLLTLGLIFFAATLWHYNDLQRHFEVAMPDLREELRRLDNPAITPEYKDWYARALLEEIALKRRYQQNAIGLQARIWTRMMGFLTGMVLVFSGCIFILGKLREDVQMSGDVQGAKWALVTSSPGLVLALAGTVLMALAIYVPSTIESTDSVVYLPVQAKVLAPAKAPPAAPPDMAPSHAGGTPPPMPAAVLEALQTDAGRGVPPSPQSSPQPSPEPPR